MRKTFSALAAATLFFAASAGATTVASPKHAPLDPAVPIAQVTPDSITQEFTLEEAEKFLKSHEGSFWSVLTVTAPACENNKNKHTCSKLKVECKKAEAFAKKHSLHASCSALYPKTKVVLTTHPDAFN